LVNVTDYLREDDVQGRLLSALNLCQCLYARCSCNENSVDTLFLDTFSCVASSYENHRSMRLVHSCLAFHSILSASRRLEDRQGWEEDDVQDTLFVRSIAYLDWQNVIARDNIYSAYHTLRNIA